MTRKPHLFNLSKAKIKELLEGMHFGNLESNADRAKSEKKGEISHDAFAETGICADNLLQVTGTCESINTPEVAPDEESYVYHDEIHISNGGMGTIDRGNNSPVREEEGALSNNSVSREEKDTKSALKNSMESTFSQLNNNHDVAKNNAAVEKEDFCPSSKNRTDSTVMHSNNNYKVATNNAALEQGDSHPSSKYSMESTVSHVNNNHRVSKNNGVLREQGDSRSSSKNSNASAVSILNSNHQVSKNRKSRTVILKGPSSKPTCTGNAPKVLPKKCPPKSGVSKDFVTHELKVNSELENPLKNEDSGDEDKNISRNNGQAMKENQIVCYMTSPPSVSEGAITPDGDWSTLDQRALASQIFPQMEDIESSPERMKAKIEELQISLLESSMEYEIKILELKMNMLQNKSQHPQVELDSMHMQLDPEISEKLQMQLAVVSKDSNNFEKPDVMNLDYSRDQMCKILQENEALTKELVELRKIGRQFEIQSRNFQYAIQRVNWLQRELSRKEEELVDCQFREMEAKARLHEIQIGLQSAQAARTENRKLSNLIPSLGDWLQSLKKIEAVKCNERHMIQIQQYEASLARIFEECLPPNGTQNQAKHNQELSTSWLGTQYEKNPTGSAEERVEVQALQRELEKLACCR